MTRPYGEIAFTVSVTDLQERYGSRAFYERRSRRSPPAEGPVGHRCRTGTSWRAGPDLTGGVPTSDHPEPSRQGDGTAAPDGDPLCTPSVGAGGGAMGSLR